MSLISIFVITIIISITIAIIYVSKNKNQRLFFWSISLIVSILLLLYPKILEDNNPYKQMESMKHTVLTEKSLPNKEGFVKNLFEDNNEIFKLFLLENYQELTMDYIDNSLNNELVKKDLILTLIHTKNPDFNCHKNEYDYVCERKYEEVLLNCGDNSGKFSECDMNILDDFVDLKCLDNPTLTLNLKNLYQDWYDYEMNPNKESSLFMETPILLE